MRSSKRPTTRSSSSAPKGGRSPKGSRPAKGAGKPAKGRPSAGGAKGRGRGRGANPGRAGGSNGAPLLGSDGSGVRLQKVMAAAGVASRRKAEELIVAGKVSVNGQIVRELGTRVDPERDRILVGGERIVPERRVYYVMNKPDGVVCSAEGPVDARGRPTVLSLLPQIGERIYPVGRLDFHTRGVLILTNDGDLSAALTHPRHAVGKTYHVKFQGRLDLHELETLQRGVSLEDGTVTRPAENVSVIRETDTNTWVQLTIHQGLYRQIRRMGEAIGHPVLKLIRVAIGGLTADGLRDGEARAMNATEVYDLLASAEGEPRRR
ncbi:MAG: pseudouridine synthase [Nannocystaceae bacterium]